MSERRAGRATILHADLDSFYASVEQRDAPHLRGRPVIVGGGVVLAASYEAKAFGVRAAMGGRQARVLCPGAIVVRPRFAAYTAASEAVFAVFRDVTPQVEPLSIDEAFLEVAGLSRIAGEPLAIAERLRAEVRRRVGLPITVGVARTKFLAKVASGVAKPDGLLRVPPEAEREFLHPLPVERLWGVGRVTADKLHTLGVRTVGDVARLGEPALVSLLGRAAGRHLSALAEGRDPRAVDTGRRRRSIGSQRALGRRILRTPDDIAAVEALLAGIVDRLGRRLRAGHRVCRTLVLRLRFADYTRATRSHTLGEATAHTPTLLEAARRLLREALPILLDRGLTLLGISLTNLRRDDAVQLMLPFDARSGPELDATLDALRARFGTDSVLRAARLGRDEGVEAPYLPDG